MTTRRKSLLAAGATAMALVAGCTGLDVEYGNDTNESNSTNGLSYGDLKIREHGPTIRNDQPMIAGIAANTGDELYEYVEVNVRVYDDEDRHLGQFMTNTSDLGAGREWPFEVDIFGIDTGAAADHDIGIWGDRG